MRTLLTIDDILTAPNSRLFAAFLRQPHDHFLRIDERIEHVNSTTMRRNIRLWMRLGSRPSPAIAPRGAEAPARQRPVVIPLLSFRRDRLVNDVTVCADDGSPLELLNRRQTASFLEWAVQASVLTTLEPWSRTGGQTHQKVARQLARLVGQIPYGNSRTAIALYDSVFTSDPILSPDLDLTAGATSTLKAQASALLREDPKLMALCKTLTTHDYMLVTLPTWSPRVTVRVVYDSMHTPRDQDRKLGAKARRYLAHLPHSYRVNIPLALRTQSYHLRMHGPEGDFVAEQSLRVPGDPRSLTDQDRITGPPPDPMPPLKEPVVQLGRPTRPNNEAHVFLANGYMGDIDKLYARVVFYEKPPGMLGAAFVLSTTLALMLLAFLLNLRQLIAVEGGAIDGAALLALAPGLAAAVLLPSMGDEVVRQGPLRARVAMLATQAVSLTAAATLLIFDGHVGPNGDVPSFYYALLLVMIAVLAFVSLAVGHALRLTTRTFRYAQADYCNNNDQLGDRYTADHLDYLRERDAR
jgi:hypothetical protein